LDEHGIQCLTGVGDEIEKIVVKHYYTITPRNDVIRGDAQKMVNPKAPTEACHPKL